MSKKQKKSHKYRKNVRNVQKTGKIRQTYKKNDKNFKKTGKKKKLKTQEKPTNISKKR